MGDGRAEGSSATGDGGQAAVSLCLMLMTHVFLSLKVHNLNI